MKKGYTLIETLIAVSIVMIVALVFIRSYSAANISMNKIKNKSEALLICKNKIEMLKSNKGELDNINNNNGVLNENEKGFDITTKVIQKEQKNNLILYTIYVEVRKEKINPIRLTTKILFYE